MFLFIRFITDKEFITRFQPKPPHCESIKRVFFVGNMRNVSFL